jgi:hypothetical protein
MRDIASLWQHHADRGDGDRGVSRHRRDRQQAEQFLDPAPFGECPLLA